MSYILDALRKAERERGIKQVPTLMTNHAPRSVHRNRIWAVLSIVGVCAAAIAWYFVYSQREPDGITKVPAPNQNTASIIDDSAPTSASITQPSAIQKTEPSIEKSARATVAPGIPPAIVSRDVPAKRIAEALRRIDQPNEEEDLTPSDEEDEETMPPAEALRNLQRVKTNPAGGETVKTGSISLQDAIGKMTLSLLVFADTKEERMVFINGDKYVEGDRVDGIYLLESITMDGAILTYQGERALLKPKSK